jgi:hypothetical protein
LDLSNLQELRDFARVAIVFRPLRGEIASRFAPASTYRSDPDDIIQQGNIKSTAKEAALMGQYGPLTQIVTRFIPEKLLAKRFNVPYTVLSEEFEVEAPSHTAASVPTSEIVQQIDTAPSPQSMPLHQHLPLDAEKEPLDVFQSVFGNNDSDTDDE